MTPSMDPIRTSASDLNTKNRPRSSRTEALAADRFLAPAAGKPSVDKIPTARFVTTRGGLFAWYDDPDRCAALVAEGL
jgi:hypothetical protein